MIVVQRLYDTQGGFQRGGAGLAGAEVSLHLQEQVRRDRLIDVVGELAQQFFAIHGANQLPAPSSSTGSPHNCSAVVNPVCRTPDNAADSVAGLAEIYTLSVKRNPKKRGSVYGLDALCTV
ncbi:MAG TPA: hypothetical protein VE178_00930 [Silvibacterium sp.]|nr:hypothetical protein [Silvibacterium sp.]